MTKIILALLPWLFAGFTYKAMAQEDLQPRKGKEQSEEIIIRKKGDKDTRITLEITGDKVLINGKPLAEFNEDGLTINKRKIIIKEGDHFAFGDDFGRNNFGWTDEAGESRAFLGVSTDKTEQGAKITEVNKESAAEKAGLQKDDIITKLDDKKIEGPKALYDAVTAKKPKEEVKISFLRNGKEKTVKATLQKKKSMTKSFSFTSPDGSFKTFTMPDMEELRNLEGMERLAEIDRLRTPMPPMGNEKFLDRDFVFNMFPGRQKLGLKIQDTEDEKGVKILEVADSSAAATAGMKKDDIITEIAGKKVSNTDEARDQLSEQMEKSTYNIKARRNGNEMSFDIKIPKKLKTANL